MSFGTGFHVKEKRNDHPKGATLMPKHSKPKADWLGELKEYLGFKPEHNFISVEIDYKSSKIIYWEEIHALITAKINKEKAQAELVGRIDELKRLPNTKPVWFDPKIHTNYIQDRLAQLEAQLTKDKEEI